MSEIKYCEVCGSPNVVVKEKDMQVLVPFANPIYYRETICHCNACNSDIRIDGDSQSEIEDKIYKSAVESVPAMLSDLNRRGFSDDRIERALYLEDGAVTNWKEGKNIDSVVIALIRFLYMLPQLIVVAEEQYDVTKLFGI